MVVMSRDPRASMLEDDPFSRGSSSERSVRPFAPGSSGARTIRVNIPPSPTAHPQNVQGFWGFAMQQPVMHHEGRLWHFSDEEKGHLLKATGAFTLALALMSVGGMLSMGSFGAGDWTANLIAALPVMLLGVGPAFVLHEIGHKLVARHYGCWAEFRGDPRGMRQGLLISALLGIVFMAPGAVVVSGMVTRRQNGHIAIAGPLVNLGLFFVGIPLGILILGLSGSANPDGVWMVESGIINWRLGIWNLVRWWLTANAILGLFNMLPFGPLDGLKVKGWSESAFWAMIAIFAAIVLVTLTGHTMAVVVGFASLI